MEREKGADAIRKLRSTHTKVGSRSFHQKKKKKTNDESLRAAGSRKKVLRCKKRNRACNEKLSIIGKLRRREG